MTQPWSVPPAPSNTIDPEGGLPPGVGERRRRLPDGRVGDYDVYVDKRGDRLEIKIELSAGAPRDARPLPIEGPPPPPPAMNMGTGRPRRAITCAPPSVAWSTWTVGKRRGFLGWKAPAPLEDEIEWAVAETIAALERRNAQLVAERAAYDAALERWMRRR